MPEKKTIAIIGGGPMGMEAALYGARAGFDVRLYERGRIAENVRQWGYIGMFTEWARNRSPLSESLLREKGFALPDPQSAPTGAELADYVLKISQLEALCGRIFPQTEVVSVTRERTLKSDFIGDARRAQRPFRLMIQGAFGEKIVHADALIDATGVYATPNFVGNGGAPCIGETRHAREIFYHLPDVAKRDHARFADKHTLVVGSGHSAASTLRSIGALMPQHPHTRLTWLVRRDVPPHGFPYTISPEDDSPHRQQLHHDANELSRHPNVSFHARSVVERIERVGLQFRVTISSAAPAEYSEGAPEVEYSEILCDNIAAHTGFRPAPSLWRELQVQPHFATEGVMALSRRVVEENKRLGVGLSTGYAEKNPQENAGESAPDDEAGEWRVLNQRGAAVLLQHPEPNFYVLGIKSYGRDAGFLLHNGFRQVRAIYQLLSGDETLDLYGEAFG